jgi:Zinc-finger associated domain (zf-AD)/Zinc finger, C2H2 type
MENVCRLCARQSQPLESVFSFQNGGRLLTDLIAVICPIRIDVNDNLPKQICEECLEIVVSASKLRETSVKSDINFRTGKFVISQEAPKLSTQIKQEKSVDEIIEDPLTSSYFETHSDNNSEDDESRDTTKSLTAKEKPTKTRKPVRLSENQFRWPCPSECGKSFSHQTNVNRHIRRFHDPELLPLPCLMCTFRFKSENKLKNHLIRAHEGAETLKKEEKQQQSCISESCDICGEKLESQAKAEVHRKRNHNEEQNTNSTFFECDICGRGYTQKENIEQHFKTCHLNASEKDAAKPKVSSAGVFYCDICFKEFSFIGNMYRHKNRFHSTINAYPCKLCTDRCKTLRMLQLHHERFHKHQDFVQTQGMKPEKGLVTTGHCQFCGADFHGLKRRLEAHLLKKHCDELEEVLECEMCHKKFAFADTLRVHIQTHNKKIKTQSYPHCCETCGRRFLNEESLLRHLESHKTEAAVACHICGKSMSSSMALECHIRRHQVISLNLQTTN